MDLAEALGDLSTWRELTADEFEDWKNDGLPADFLEIETTGGSLLYFGRDRQSEATDER